MRRAKLLANAAEVWIGLCVGYLLTLLAAAIASERRPPTRAEYAGSGPAGPEHDQASRPFLITLVPAHDEELCIADAVRSLALQDYPRTRHETIVIADNCGDATAARAAAAGATVWERTDPELRGKGPALHWALDRVWRQRPEAEAIAFLDADCIASQNFLSALATAIEGGSDAVQGKYLVSNAGEAPEAALRAAAFYLMNQIRPAGKSALGLSCGLLGSGMAFTAELLRDVPWDSFSVTEDTEFHLRLLRAGHVVKFVESASVSSPMPTTARAARSQQLRWETGNATIATGTAPRLLLAAVSGRDLQLAHGALERYVPAQSLLATLALTFALRRGRWGTAARIICGAELVYVSGGLLAAGAPPAVWCALPYAPVLVLRRLRLVCDSLLAGTETEWVRTERQQVPADA